MVTLNKRLPFFLVLFWLVFSHSAVALSLEAVYDSPQNDILRLRERIEFDVKWWFVPLVATYMETYQEPGVEDPAFYRLTHQAAPNTFWNDRMESIIDSKSLLPCQTETIVKDEGRQRRNRIVFNRDLGRAKLLCDDGENGSMVVSIVEINEKSMDPLSAFYYLRKRLSPRNPYLVLKGITGSRRFSLSGKLVAEEKIGVPAGQFRAYRLECNMQYWEQNEKKGTNANHLQSPKKNPFILWVSQDEHRFPVQIRYRLPLGSLWVRAISVES